MRAAPQPIRTPGNPQGAINIEEGEARSREDYVRGYDFVVTTLLRWQPHDPYGAWRAPTRPIVNIVLPDPPSLDDA